MKKIEDLHYLKGNFFLAMLLLHFIVLALIFFDVPIARQVIGFLYFTFVPGFLALKILKVELEMLEVLLFSMGLSIAFLELLGLSINEFCFLFGIRKPLTLLPLVIIINVFIFLNAFLAYFLNRDHSILIGGFRAYPSVIGLIVLPIMSIVGSVLMNAYGDNTLLLAMIIMLILWFITGVTSKRILPQKLYPFAILMMAISLLFHSSLTSNYIFPYGSDAPLEYYVSRNTENAAYWNSTEHFSSNILGRFYSMLSITILPTVYSSLLKIDLTWIFKILFPLIFSFLSLGLYQLYKERIGEKHAFIAVFFFMSYETFYTEIMGLNRQMIAELFFVLTPLVILNNKMKRVPKTILFTIFSFGIVTSHYGLSEIFLFFIFSAFIYLFLIKRPSKNITPSMIVLFFAVMSLWYVYVSFSSVFNSIIEFANYVYTQLGEFFNPSSRDPAVLRGLGLESPPTIWHAISRTFAYITEALIFLGFIDLLLKIVKAKFEKEKEYSIFVFIAGMLLAALILVPGLANTMNMTRFYHILLFFLSPLCVVGAELLFKLFKRHEKSLIPLFLLAILIPYFLFQTCFVFEIVKCKSSSVPLSRYRMNPVQLYYSFGYIDANDVYGVQWLSKNMVAGKSVLYADFAAHWVITSYGAMLINYYLSNISRIGEGGIVYLSTLNTIHETVVSDYFILNTNELCFIFCDLNMIYNDGGCILYKK